MVTATCRQDAERIASLEAEIVVVRAALVEALALLEKATADKARITGERDELAATVEALKAKIVELTKQVFGGRSERAKNNTREGQGSEGEDVSDDTEAPEPPPSRPPMRDRPSASEASNRDALGTDGETTRACPTRSGCMSLTRSGWSALAVARATSRSTRSAARRSTWRSSSR